MVLPLVYRTVHDSAWTDNALCLLWDDFTLELPLLSGNTVSFPLKTTEDTQMHIKFINVTSGLTATVQLDIFLGERKFFFQSKTTIFMPPFPVSPRTQTWRPHLLPGVPDKTVSSLPNTCQPLPKPAGGRDRGSGEREEGCAGGGKLLCVQGSSIVSFHLVLLSDFRSFRMPSSETQASSMK